MVKTRNVSIEDIKTKDIKSLSYYATPVESEWSIDILKEIQDAKFGGLMIPNLSRQELDDITKLVST